jgi:type II secretory pathway predicted ATPase ExeA
MESQPIEDGSADDAATARELSLFGPKGGQRRERGITVVPLRKSYDEDLQKRFVALIFDKDKNPEGQFSLGDLERILKENKSQLSQYKNGKPVGNVVRLEGAVRDFFKREEQRAKEADKNQELFKWTVTNRVRNVARLCMRHGYMGAIIGEPGCGKSCALTLLREEPEFQDAVSIELHRFLGGGTPRTLSRRVMEQCDTRGYYRHMQTPGEWIASRFAFSGRLLIIDNADELPRGGLEWVVGFFNLTRCPVLLVGNEELDETIKLVPRAISRIGVREIISVDGAMEEEARNLIRLHFPQAMELLPRVKEMMKGVGMLRSVVNALKTARGKYEKDQGRFTAREVFDAAREMLPRAKTLIHGRARR